VLIYERYINCFASTSKTAKNNLRMTLITEYDCGWFRQLVKKKKQLI